MVKHNLTMKELEEVIEELLDIEIWIYPKSVQGEYEERTEFMEGYNKAATSFIDQFIKISDKYGIEIYD